MKIDETYRRAYSKITPGESLLERTRHSMDAARQGRKSRRSAILKTAAGCCAAILILCSVPLLLRLSRSGTNPADNLAVAAASTAGAANPYAGGTDSPSSAGKTLTGGTPASSTASDSPSSAGKALTGGAAPSSAASVSSAVSSRQGVPLGNVCIPMWMTYSDGLYHGAGTVSHLQLGEKNGNIWSGQPCYAVQGVPVSESIVVDYNGAYMRYNYAASSLVRFQNKTYRMNASLSCGTEADEKTRIGTYQKFALYRDTKDSNRIWVDVSPLFSITGNPKQLVRADQVA